jgi:sugar O-acyltransferase (sialic acid O-acetyltransferase NeuD family)
MRHFIFGSSGFAREVDWLINDIYRLTREDYQPHFFVSEDSDPQIGESINSIKVISETEFFQKYNQDFVRCFLGIGSPRLKRKIYRKIRQANQKATFPNLIHPSASFDHRKGKVNLGIGNIICANNAITTDVTMADFVTINLNCTIGHDCFLGSFTTVSPGVNISGRVEVEEAVFIGTNASVNEGVKIAHESVIGAGATVVGDLKVSGTYVGTPAKRIN